MITKPYGFGILFCAKGDSPLKPQRPTDAGTGQQLASTPHRDALNGSLKWRDQKKRKKG